MQRDVLREYLISLGFRVDTRGWSRMFAGIDKTDNKLLSLSNTIAGTTAALAYMTHQFAQNMTSLYYMSQRTLTPVRNLQAFAYAAKQIGIDADAALQSVEALSAEIRKNPGKQALLSALGVSDKGASNLERMHSLVQGLNKRFPYFIAQQFAEQFGIPEQMFFQLTHNYDELLKREREHNELMKQMGVDSDAAAKAAVDYSREVEKLGMQFDVLKQKAGAALLPALQGFMGGATRAFDMGTKVDEGSLDWLFEDKGKGLWGFTKEKTKQLYDWLIPENVAPYWVDKLGANAPGGTSGKLHGWMTNMNNRNRRAMGLPEVPGRGVVDHNQADWPSTPEMVDRFLQRQGSAGTGNALRDMARRVAGDVGIPASLFESLIKKESNWNELAVSRKGAYGLTQLMPGTASDLGVDRTNTYENLMGGARYLKQQYQTFGNWRDALAAYNTGPHGNLSSVYGSYADPILKRAMEAEGGRGGGNITLNQKTDIHVSGSGDPAGTAREVAREQRGVNSDLTRNFASSPQ